MSTPIPKVEREALIVKAARILSNSAASVCGVDKDDNWAIYSEAYLLEARAIFDELFPEASDAMIAAGLPQSQI